MKFSKEKIMIGINIMALLFCLILIKETFQAKEVSGGCVKIPIIDTDPALWGQRVHQTETQSAGGNHIVNGCLAGDPSRMAAFLSMVMMNVDFDNNDYGRVELRHTPGEWWWYIDVDSDDGTAGGAVGGLWWQQ